MMYSAADLPIWAAIAVAVFLLIGAGLALIGACGFLRLPDFYERLHAPSLVSSWGIGGVMLASMIFFTVVSSRPVVHEILIGIFITITTPINLMLLSRAALHRDRAEDNGNVPHKPEQPEQSV